MAQLNFWKLQSIGNDFPIIHLADVAHLDIHELAIRLCDRRLSIGGDGLLAVGMEGTDLRLRMFNPDGTEDFCGNGLRCAAQHAFNIGWVGFKFNILHLDKVVATSVTDELVTTVLGPASYEPAKVPHTGVREFFDCTIWSGMVGGYPLSLFGSSLTTGSTHTIIPTTVLPDDESFNSVAPIIEHSDRFPDRTSVIWVKEVEPMKLAIRIWERGVGETLGCGTGSSAAAIDYLRRKGADSPREQGYRVEVQNPGGSVFVRTASWFGDISLEGVAHNVFQGTVQIADPPVVIENLSKP